jgi:hypothetical protein
MSHATRDPAIASWKAPAPVPVSSAWAVFFPLTLTVLPVRTFQTSTFVVCGFLASRELRSYATRSPSIASAPMGSWSCRNVAVDVAVVPDALVTSTRPDTSPVASTRKARPSFCIRGTSSREVRL